MKDQINTIREALAVLEAIGENDMYAEEWQKTKQALTALTQLEAMAGEQEPVADINVRPSESGGTIASVFSHKLPVGSWLLYRAAPVAQPQAEPDMRKVCEVLGFDPTNHHNAAKCPYCRGQQPQAEAAPPDVVRDADVEAAAKKMAEIFDYPWDFMPEKGRNTMRENVRAVLTAAQGEKP